MNRFFILQGGRDSSVHRQRSEAKRGAAADRLQPDPQDGLHHLHAPSLRTLRRERLQCSAGMEFNVVMLFSLPLDSMSYVI